MRGRGACSGVVVLGGDGSVGWRREEEEEDEGNFWVLKMKMEGF